MSRWNLNGWYSAVRAPSGAIESAPITVQSC